MNRFKLAGSHTLEPRLTECGAITEGLAGLHNYEYFESNESEETVVARVLSMLPSAGPFVGNFPDVAGHKRVKDDYLAWLSARAAADR